MTNAQVSTARKFATAAFAGVVALSLMLPTQLAYADYWFGDRDQDTTVYEADKDNSGEGWTYTADGQQMALVNYVGEAIHAQDQDLNVTAEGENKVEDGITVSGGNLSITGEEGKYGEDKSSLTMVSSEERIAEAEKYNGTASATIAAYSGYTYDETAGTGVAKDGQGSVTIKDMNITFESGNGTLRASNGDLTIEDSKVARGSGNKNLSIAASGSYDSKTQTSTEKDVLLKGSEIEATSVSASGTLTIDNTNLNVTKPDGWDEDYQGMLEYYKEQGYDYKWVEHAVTAVKIVLKGEENGEVIDATTFEGKAYQYLYTGSDDKIELKASSTPAYWGATKGMPATGDATTSLIATLSMAAMAAAALGAFSLRSRKVEGKHTK